MIRIRREENIFTLLKGSDIIVSILRDIGAPAIIPYGVLFCY